MQIDLAGQVNAIRLGTSKALLPLFEAVVNSVQSIDERRIDDGLIEITVRRSGLGLGGNGDDPQFAPDIVDFEIADNGVGFTEKHFRSFDTSFSTLKASIGGKGVGRLVWLKAFERAEIRSLYPEGGRWSERHFHFQMTSRGIEGASLREIDNAPASPLTVVTLAGFKNVYREAAPKRADTIARRIVEHCLVLYMINAMPKVVIKDPAMGTVIDLGSVYREEVAQSSEARDFTVRGQTFSIIDVLLRPSAEVQSAIHFCANKREVQARRESDVIAHADNAITLDGIELRYAACVTSPYLDEVVNEQRTGFNLDDDAALALAPSNITWTEIEEAAVAAAAEFLTPHLEEAKEKAVARVERFITEEEPRYRILLEHRRGELERLSGSLNDERLEMELHRILASWRFEAKREVQRKMKAASQEPDDYKKHERDVVAAIERLAEVVKADLAEYVLHRRLVLDFFADVLRRQESGKFVDEHVLHGLFFPTRTTSNRVDYDKHNLWMLDERLAFHKFLASDVEFGTQVEAPVRVVGKDRPDLLIYNHPIAFAEGGEATNSVVIVEFKKPERNDYKDSENPIDQVLEYVEQIMAGTALRSDGSRVLPPREGTPFYCHIVVSISPKLRALAHKRGFHSTPDGQGFFYFNANYKAYIEIVDYQKVLCDALKRNKVFFERLGLHTGPRRPLD